MSDVSMKQCTRCEKEKPATEEYFRKQGKGRGKLHSWCKQCNREYARERRKQKQKEKQQNHWHRVRRQRGEFVKEKQRTDFGALLVHPRQLVRLDSGRVGLVMLIL